MAINDFIREIHDNSVTHGWWETDRPFAEIIALIHSELSESLEEYRAGRPMVWFPTNCDCQVCGDRPAMNADICSADKCEEGHKPEGIAVEMADACIRIFDWFGKIRFGFDDNILWSMPYEPTSKYQNMDLPTTICHLHMETSMAYADYLEWLDSDGEEESLKTAAKELANVVTISNMWFRRNGLDLLEIMRIKHEYNKSREYRHGGKKC